MLHKMMADIARLLNHGGVDSSAMGSVIADYFALEEDPVYDEGPAESGL